MNEPNVPANMKMRALGVCLVIFIVVWMVSSFTDLRSNARDCDGDSACENATAMANEAMEMDDVMPNAAEGDYSASNFSARDLENAGDRSGLPSAVVDGVEYSGQQQIDAMTQAARDAGMDEATAQSVGRDAAALCGGDPACLR